MKRKEKRQDETEGSVFENNFNLRNATVVRNNRSSNSRLLERNDTQLI